MWLIILQLVVTKICSTVFYYFTFHFWVCYFPSTLENFMHNIFRLWTNYTLNQFSTEKKRWENSVQKWNLFFSEKIFFLSFFYSKYLFSLEENFLLFLTEKIPTRKHTTLNTFVSRKLENNFFSFLNRLLSQ